MPFPAELQLEMIKKERNDKSTEDGKPVDSMKIVTSFYGDQSYRERSSKEPDTLGCRIKAGSEGNRTLLCHRSLSLLEVGTKFSFSVGDVF